MVHVRIEQSAIFLLVASWEVSCCLAPIYITLKHRIDTSNTDVINEMAIPRDHLLPVNLAPFHVLTSNSSEVDDST
jgi:hypothetical protein